jgi:hypothetical protein
VDHRDSGPPWTGGHGRARELAGAWPPAAPVPESSDRGAVEREGGPVNSMVGLPRLRRRWYGGSPAAETSAQKDDGEGTVRARLGGVGGVGGFTVGRVGFYRVGGLSHPVFKAKTRCSSYVCPGSSCHTYGQNVSTEYQCLHYIVSYYKNLLQVQKGLNSGMDPILPQAADRGFRTPRRNLHQCTPHPLSSRT